MEIKLTEFAFKINNKQVTVHELVDHWMRTHTVVPQNAAIAYGYYQKNAKDVGDSFKHAIWHPDTVVGENEVKVPGYFIPLVEYARFGINAAHQEIVSHLNNRADGVTSINELTERGIMEALQRVWAPQDKWENAVRVALKRAGVEEHFNADDPHDTMTKLAAAWELMALTMTDTDSEAPVCKDTFPEDGTKSSGSDINAYEVQSADKLIQPEVGMLFQHTDGGLYKVVGNGLSSVDKSLVVIYEHRWPFERGLWTRPLVEWYSRFTAITEDQYVRIVNTCGREAMQEIITKRRTERKAQTYADMQSADAQTDVIEYLEDSPVVEGQVLFDAQGRKWVAHQSTNSSYAFCMKPLEPQVGDPSTWHTNQYQANGVQLLFWTDPHADLKLRWEPSMDGSTSVWRTETPFGTMRVIYDSTRAHPWFVSAWSGNVPSSDRSGYATANRAMYAAERTYSLKLSKAKGELCVSK